MLCIFQGNGKVSIRISGDEYFTLLKSTGCIRQILFEGGIDVLPRILRGSKSTFAYPMSRIPTREIKKSICSSIRARTATTHYDISQYSFPYFQ